MKWHNVEHDLERSRGRRSGERAHGVYGHPIESPEFFLVVAGPVPPDHRGIGKHGSYNADVGPAHKLRFWAPVSFRDVGDMGEELLCFTNFIVYMLSPCELTVECNA